MLSADLAAEARRVLAEIDAGRVPDPRSFPFAIMGDTERWWQLSAASMGGNGYVFVLRDITVANVFFESSTRTRISFELAEKRLSADVVNFSASGSSVSKGETLVDTVNNILAMKVDMVVMRHPHPGGCVYLSRHIEADAGEGQP